MRYLIALAVIATLSACNGIPGLSTNTIQTFDSDGNPANFYTLAKFDNLVGPSVAVLELNGEFKEAFSETGLIGAVATGAGIATTGFGHDYVGDDISVSQEGGGARAGSRSSSAAESSAKSSALASATATQKQKQGQFQGQRQYQKQGPGK